jgi:serine protease
MPQPAGFVVRAIRAAHAVRASRRFVWLTVVLAVLALLAPRAGQGTLAQPTAGTPSGAAPALRPADPHAAAGATAPAPRAADMHSGQVYVRLESFALAATTGAQTQAATPGAEAPARSLQQWEALATSCGPLELSGRLARQGLALVPILPRGAAAIAVARGQSAARGRFARARTAASFTPLQADAAQGVPAAVERLLRWRAVRPLSSRAARAGLPNVDALVSWLRTVRGIEAAEPGYLTAVCAVPGDPWVGSQPYLGLVDAFSAYDRVRGADGDVVVAIVDGGTDWHHEDLWANVWDRPGEIDGNGVDDDGNGYVDDVHGWNFADNTPDPTGLPQTPASARHGTHIAGLIGAISGNGIGVAGMSWNARLLLVNAAFPDGDGLLAYGYDGLVYGALSGAAILNASWGRGVPQRWSQYEADVVAAVTAMGSLVVAAAGNDGTSEPFYPAFYPGALSVTAVDPNLQLMTFTNHAPWIDVAAPGLSLFSTLPGNTYGSLTGTSQAAAIVSGAAALVATLRPDLGPLQIGERLRWTARPLDDLNPGAHGELGSGIIQAGAALEQDPPGIIADRIVLSDDDGDGLVEPGDLLTVGVDLHNELAAAENVTLTLATADPALVLLEQSVHLNRVLSGEALQVRRGLRVWIRPEAAVPGALATLRLLIDAGGRQTHTAFYPEIHPLHATLRSQRVDLTVTCTGKIGYSALTRAIDPGGEGLHAPGAPSRLLLGSLLVGDGPQRVADALIPPAPDDPFEDFYPQAQEALVRETGPGAQETIVANYSDRASTMPLDVTVRQVSRAFGDDARGGFVLCRYEVSAARDARPGVRLGVLLDWEMRPDPSGVDQAFLDPQRRLAWAVDATGDARAGAAAGVLVLEGPGSFTGGWLYDEPVEGTTGPTLFGPPPFYASIDDAALWEMMLRPPITQPSPLGEVASVVAMGPVDLLPGHAAVLSLAFLVAPDALTLLREAEAARVQYAAFQAGFSEGMPMRPELLPNGPNPFNPTTELRFTLPAAAAVRLRLFDTRGRLVAVPLDATLPAGFYRIPWSGIDVRGAAVGSGIYHVVLETPWGTRSGALTLLR